MIDWTKPIQTRDGRPARYVGEYKGRHQTRIVTVRCGGEEVVHLHHEDGSYFKSTITCDDIVNTPPPKLTGTLFVNVYPEDVCAHLDRGEADRGASKGRIACVEVKWTEGEGLEGL